MQAKRLWTPTQKAVERSHLLAFANLASKRTGQDLRDWPKLYKWSAKDTCVFWDTVADYCKIKWIHRGQGPAYMPPATPGTMRGAKWFDGSQLNFAQNLMPAATDKEVLVCLGDGGGAPIRRYTGRSLHTEVARCAAALRREGVVKGDSVASVLPNTSDALVCMLATTSLGAVYSSCSPDFGTAGVLDRIGQVKPKVVFLSTGYKYNGKHIDCGSHIPNIISGLQKLNEGTRLKAISVPLYSKLDNSSQITEASMSGAIPLSEFLHSSSPVPPLYYEPTSFDHPVYTMFSSGTTGLPKCMLHSAGGTLIQQKKELMLHCDLHAGDKLLYFTTTGWMMWNWMASALAVECASLVTYDGSPSYPDLNVLWKACADLNVTHLGVSPKLIGACMAAGVEPHLFDLSSLRVLLSTGSPLMHEHYDWVYDKVKTDLHLASISGGTDILGCFMLGNPILPVHSGEIQSPGLGMDICAYDVHSKEAVIGKTAELVCRTPFPSMPIKFLNDESGAKYKDAYFSQLGDGMWRHGDYIEVNEHTGGIIVHGRSDATLNPGGVRIGTAELYRQMDLIPSIKDSVAVARRNHAGDVDIILFVKVAEGVEVDDVLISTIKTTIRKQLTPRHVPRAVLAVRDIPYTRNGKKVEVAVTKAIHGEKVDNASALENPQCLDEYYKLGVHLNSIMDADQPKSKL